MFSLNNLNNLNNLGSMSSGTAWYNKSDIKLNSVLPTLIHKYDTQQYYNSADGATTIPFTPTRTSNATMILANGNMGWAPANLYTRSDVGDAGWAASSSTNTIDSSVSSPTSTVVRKLVTNNGVTANANDSVGGVVAPGFQSSDVVNQVSFFERRKGFAVLRLHQEFNVVGATIFSGIPSSKEGLRVIRVELKFFFVSINGIDQNFGALVRGKLFGPIFLDVAKIPVVDRFSTRDLEKDMSPENSKRGHR